MSQRRVAGARVLGLMTVLSLVSCTSGPPPVKMGTPEWFWSSAREQYAAGDFAKTQEHLERLMAGESPFRARAATWHLVVLAGMARGHRELADAYADGAPGAKANTSEFRRTVNDQRRLSRQFTIGLAEEVGRFQKELGGAEKIALEFAFPIGSAAEPPILNNIRRGLLPQEQDRAKAHRESIARGVLLQASEVAGEEAAKAAEVFKTLPVQVPRAVFLYGLANSLVDQSALFDRRKLQEPEKKKILLQLASDLVKSASETADDAGKKKIKALQAKIEKETKNIGKT